MARLDSWLSPDVMHALGWALIHSLWQCLGAAALAAVLMAFSRRPSIRYLVGVGALGLMLAMPVATFLVLMQPAMPVQAAPTAPVANSAVSAMPGASIPPVFSTARIYPGAVISRVIEERAITAISDTPRPLPNILPWLVMAWLCGVALFSLRFAAAFLLLERKTRRQSAALSPSILALCRQLERQLGLRRTIRYPGDAAGCRSRRWSAGFARSSFCRSRR